MTTSALPKPTPLSQTNCSKYANPVPLLPTPVPYKRPLIPVLSRQALVVAMVPARKRASHRLILKHKEMLLKKLVSPNWSPTLSLSLVFQLRQLLSARVTSRRESAWGRVRKDPSKLRLAGGQAVGRYNTGQLGSKSVDWRERVCEIENKMNLFQMTIEYSVETLVMMSMTTLWLKLSPSIQLFSRLKSSATSSARRRKDLALSASEMHTISCKPWERWTVSIAVVHHLSLMFSFSQGSMLGVVLFDLPRAHGRIVTSLK